MKAKTKWKKEEEEKKNWWVEKICGLKKLLLFLFVCLFFSSIDHYIAAIYFSFDCASQIKLDSICPKIHVKFFFGHKSHKMCISLNVKKNGAKRKDKIYTILRFFFVSFFLFTSNLSVLPLIDSMRYSKHFTVFTKIQRERGRKKTKEINKLIE